MNGKVALVTGAARAPGLGRATAVRLAQQGADIACVDVPPSDGDPTDSSMVVAGALDALADDLRELGRRVLSFELDPADATAVQAAVSATVAELGRLDVCCHFAGGTGPSLGTGPLLTIDEKAWDRCIDTNLISAWIVARACAEAMVRSGDGGSIVMLSSFAARNTPEGYGAFSAAREGVGAPRRGPGPRVGRVGYQGERRVAVGSSVRPTSEPWTDRARGANRR